MSKQFNFFATEDDKIMIADILNNFFGELIMVPVHKGKFISFDPIVFNENYYLAEKNRENDVYYLDKYYDGTPTDHLNDRESPVLEYHQAKKYLKENYYIDGRFYCCSEDKEFLEKVSKLFKIIKKQFYYAKKYKIYISKTIDVENSFFLIPNETKKISTEDIK